MIRQILEECQQGFNEVVLMLSNEVATAEVYMTLSDLRFNEKGDIVTFMADGETHLHMYLEQVKEVQFRYRQNNEQDQPSYSVWFMNDDQEPVLRIYMRKSEKAETNQPRHALFMSLLEKYGSKVQLGV